MSDNNLIQIKASIQEEQEDAEHEKRERHSGGINAVRVWSANTEWPSF